MRLLPTQQVGYFRRGAEVFQQLAAAREFCQPRHLALRIVQVTEYERLRGAALSAGRHDVAVLHFAGGRGVLPATMRCVQKVHFFHDADFTKRDVRIEL